MKIKMYAFYMDPNKNTEKELEIKLSKERFCWIFNTFYYADLLVSRSSTVYAVKYSEIPKLLSALRSYDYLLSEFEDQTTPKIKTILKRMYDFLYNLKENCIIPCDGTLHLCLQEDKPVEKS